MNKSLFNKIVKEVKKEIDGRWSDVRYEELDTSKFKYPGDTSIRINHNVPKSSIKSDWHVQIDYNKTDEDGKTRPVKERSAGFYYSVTLNNGDRIFRSVFAFPKYDSSEYNLITTVNVNNKTVAEFTRVVDTEDIDGKISKEIGQDFYRAIFVS